MDGIGGARGYGAFTGPVAGDGSVSILRKASDAAQHEIGRSEVGESAGPAVSSRSEPSAAAGADVGEDDATAAASDGRPIGNLGHHLDLRL